MTQRMTYCVFLPSFENLVVKPANACNSGNMKHPSKALGVIIDESKVSTPAAVEIKKR